MITYKLHLIRSGTTSSGEASTYLGQQDLPLSPQGQAELLQLAKEFDYPSVVQVYSSPLKRSLQTAEILYPNTLLIPTADLTDLNLGEFQGKSLEELRDQPAFLNWVKNSTDHSPPGGEDTATFTLRILTAVETIFAEMMKTRTTDVALITHGGVIMTLLAAIGLPKAPLPDWAVLNGTGYTLLMTPQLWMRDHAAEVYARVPALPQPPLTAEDLFS